MPLSNHLKVFHFRHLFTLWLILFMISQFTYLVFNIFLYLEGINRSEFLNVKPDLEILYNMSIIFEFIILFVYIPIMIVPSKIKKLQSVSLQIRLGMTLYLISIPIFMLFIMALIFSVDAVIDVNPHLWIYFFWFSGLGLAYINWSIVNLTFKIKNDVKIQKYVIIFSPFIISIILSLLARILFPSGAPEWDAIPNPKDILLIATETIAYLVAGFITYLFFGFVDRRDVTILKKYFK